nr:hypothetical protein [Roseomonas sp. KE2513]
MAEAVTNLSRKNTDPPQESRVRARKHQPQDFLRNILKNMSASQQTNEIVPFGLNFNPGRPDFLKNIHLMARTPKGALFNIISEPGHPCPQKMFTVRRSGEIVARQHKVKEDFASTLSPRSAPQPACPFAPLSLARHTVSTTRDSTHSPGGSRCQNRLDPLVQASALLQRPR